MAPPKTAKTSLPPAMFRSRPLCGALELAEGVSDPWRLATLYMGLSLACSKKGDYSGAIDCAERARHLFASLGNSKLVASILNNIGIAHAAKEEWPQAIEYFKQSFNLFEKVSDESGVAHVLTEMAKYHRHCEEYDEAMQLCQKALLQRSCW